MSVMCPVRSARQRGATRMPTRIASATPQSTTCSSAVSAPSGRISANANGFVERVLARPRLRDPGEGLHRSARPDLDPVRAVGCDLRARRRVVLRRRHEHATVGEPDRLDAAVAQAGEEAPDHGPDRAGVAARVIEHVRFEQFSHANSLVRARCVREVPQRSLTDA